VAGQVHVIEARLGTREWRWCSTCCISQKSIVSFNVPVILSASGNNVDKVR